MYKSITLRRDFKIDKLYTVHYYEYMNDFNFEGESHDFWEFLYVDKGIIEVRADDKLHVLKKGEIIFHQPGEFHNVRANGVIAPNLVVISFECHSPAMEFYKKKILTVQEPVKSLMASIISESKYAFSSKLDDPYLTELERRPDSMPCCEQLIQLYLEQLLIVLYRHNPAKNPLPIPEKLVRKKNEDLLFERIDDYLNTHLYTHLTVEQICKDNLIGRSQLQKLFGRRCGCGVIDFFAKKKISLAKEMIREQHYNFSQISEELGYSSIHYFSRQFKKITGMTPTEYASSIKALSDKQS